MTENQESSSRKKLPIGRIILIVVLIALVVFYLVETLGTTAGPATVGLILTSA